MGLQNSLNNAIISTAQASYYGGRFNSGYSLEKMKTAERVLADQKKARAEQKKSANNLKGILISGLHAFGQEPPIQPMKSNTKKEAK